ncbi:MAG TPA: metal ABC transporter permease [bacterium]|nr:metal ABC transporter permease [bacterium]
MDWFSPVFPDFKFDWDSAAAILNHPFFQEPLLGLLLAAFSCSMLSVFVIMQRAVFAGPGTGCSFLAGLAFSYQFIPGLGGTEAMVWAVAGVFVLGMGWLTAFLNRSGWFTPDGAIGIILLGCLLLWFALSMGQEETSRVLIRYIFGESLEITVLDLGFLAGTVLLASGLTFFGYKALYIFLFDSPFAGALGFSPSRIHYLFFLILTLTLFITIKTAGIFLASAFLVLPGASARLMTSRLTRMVLLSIFLALISVLGGLALAVTYPVFSRPVFIVMVQLMFFLVILLCSMLKRNFSAPDHLDVAG